MKIVQTGIVASASDSLKGQAANASQAFEHSMEHLARLSIERWRLKMEVGLNARQRALTSNFGWKQERATTEGRVSHK